MQKYWKAISMMIVMVLGIGTFYIHKAVTASQYPDFIIETVSGDETEMSDLQLRGHYLADTSDELVQISSGGSTYSSDLSYWEQLNGGLYNSPLIERLENEYRGFMRGKNVHGNLYKDGDFLAYADI